MLVIHATVAGDADYSGDADDHAGHVGDLVM